MGYITDIERSIKFNKAHKPIGRRAMHQYRLDITVVNNDDKIVGIVEYETIDASEEHLYKKIEYFELVIPANESIEFLIYFPTLRTLQRAPSQWIKKDRQRYIEPISSKIKKLSKLIKSGNVVDEQIFKIFDSVV